MIDKPTMTNTHDDANATLYETQTTTHSSPNHLSPNVMVEAAIANVAQEQETWIGDDSTDSTTASTKRPRHDNVEESTAKDSAGTWKSITNMANELIQDGVRAYQELERTQQKLKITQEDCVAKTREIERLRASEQKSRDSIGVRKAMEGNDLHCSTNNTLTTPVASITSCS
jgi:hypothetical protein